MGLSKLGWDSAAAGEPGSWGVCRKTKILAKKHLLKQFLIFWFFFYIKTELRLFKRNSIWEQRLNLCCLAVCQGSLLMFFPSLKCECDELERPPVIYMLFLGCQAVCLGFHKPSKHPPASQSKQSHRLLSHWKSKHLRCSVEEVRLTLSFQCRT